MKHIDSLQNTFPDSILLDGDKKYHPGLSVDCVIFGFHENQMKVLLLENRHIKEWALPGGFVLKDENVDDAAYRILYDRTRVTNLFLRQFYFFGDYKRNNRESNQTILLKEGFDHDEAHWFLQRFVTVGYYALVEYTKVNPIPDSLSSSCQWWDLNDLPPMYLDHQSIINKALELLRVQLSHLPIGLNLLPEEFTMPELQKLYELILGKSLDRRNFQRKILAFNILDRIGEKRKGGAHKAPFLYRFNEEKYQERLEEGSYGGW